MLSFLAGGLVFLKYLIIYYPLIALFFLFLPEGGAVRGLRFEDLATILSIRGFPPFSIFWVKISIIWAVIKVWVGYPILLLALGLSIFIYLRLGFSAVWKPISWNPFLVYFQIFSLFLVFI